MDWLLAAPQLKSAFSSMGTMEGDTYVVNPNALTILEEINCKLIYEDQTLRTFRRAIGFGQNVRADLIPLLENTKDDNILDAVIRILVNLTVPVECLFSVDVMYRTEVGRLTIFELNKLLYTSKEAFTDPKSTKSVVDYMKHILESDSKLSLQKCDSINNCLLLLRNVLHIPEANVNFMITLPYSQQTTYTPQTQRPHGVSMQNTILWNLFIQSIDKLLLYLMTCQQRSTWGVTMVQLIALIYKDQHVNTLQKLLNQWFEASLSESSEDNESNTSPPKQGSGDSSPMLTSDPTSDSSDNGSGGHKKVGCEERRQALRDETDAMLHEVRRKGQEYKNLILLGIPSPVAVVSLAPKECKDPLQDYISEVSSSNTATALAIAIAASASSRQVVNLLSPFDQLMDTSELAEVEPLSSQVIKEEDDEEMARYSSQEDDAHENPESPMMESSHTTNKPEPAESAASTTTTKSMTKTAPGDDGSVFKPPPSLDTKRSAAMSNYEKYEAMKQSQKVPHAGKLNLSCAQKRECASSQSEFSDCGYGTQVENQESISTSSNDDDAPQGKPQHQKPPCNQKPRNKPRTIITLVDKKELRRKKLVKRSKSSLINMKGLIQHIPTDEDISNILKEFTVDFLLKGYGILVGDIHSQLLSNMQLHIDSSHFFWLVTYFLKFAAQLELDMEHISSILTYNLISFLTYEGVSLCEQLELNSRQEGCDLKPFVRRMHLVVTAIREFLQAIETYNKVSHLTAEDRADLRQLQINVCSSEDLRCLFVLLLRRYNPTLHSKQYLQDLVITNHKLLLLLDQMSQTEEHLGVTMVEHVAQFATLEVMAYYGMLLEDFCSNGAFVNDCIFTMMHHVSGDLDQIGTLFQPVILKTFSRIWEADYELCDDWSDLIEYVIHKFINTPQKIPLAIKTASLTELTKELNFETTQRTWTQEEMDTLYWYYVQSKKSTDVVGKIVKLFEKNGNKEKSRIAIIQQLLQQDIITLVEYDDLMKFEDVEYQRSLLTTPSSASTESGIDLKNSITSGKPSDDIQNLLDLIIKEHKEKYLIWLQKILVECCYIKLVFKDKAKLEDQHHLEFIMEPVAYHCILKNKPIPVVQWNNEQAVTMMYQPFVLLLHKLGFQLPADAGSIYARIPDYWNAETMFSLAKKLGPLDKVHLKFDALLLEDSIKANHCHHIARGSLSSMSSFEVDSSEISEVTGHATLPNDFDEKDEDRMQASNTVFAVPKAKHSSTMNRFTPEPMAQPTLPKWLQLVMRNKCSLLKTSEESHETIQPTADKYDTERSHVLSSELTITEIPITDPTTTAAALAAMAASAIDLTEATSNRMSVNNEDGGDSGESASLTETSLPKGAFNQQQQHQMTTDDEAPASWLDHFDSASSGVHTQSTVVGKRDADSEYSAMVAAVCKLERSNSETSLASDLTRMYVSDEEEPVANEMAIYH